MGRNYRGPECPRRLSETGCRTWEGYLCMLEDDARAGFESYDHYLLELARLAALVPSSEIRTLAEARCTEEQQNIGYTRATQDFTTEYSVDALVSAAYASAAHVAEDQELVARDLLRVADSLR